MAQLVYFKEGPPAKVVGFFEKKGIGYVKVEWSNLPKYKGYVHTGNFQVKNVIIKRIPSTFEKAIIRLWCKIFVNKTT